MIIIDYSHFLHHSVYAIQNEISLENLRCEILNRIRYSFLMHKKEYGNLVIACDFRGNWRKERVTDLYKIKRKEAREKSKFNWDEVYNYSNIVINEIKENFHYKVLEVRSAEADDIIGVLCRLRGNDENILILSEDKDFQQLQIYKKVKQYSSVKKKFLKCDYPLEFIMEHIIRGDASDGVCNVFSDMDTFVDVEKRQKSVSSKKMLEWNKMSMEEFLNETGVSKERFLTNKTLIDLREIPDDIVKSILKEFDKDTNDMRGSRITSYFIKHRLKLMIECVNDFL